MKFSRVTLGGPAHAGRWEYLYFVTWSHKSLIINICESISINR